MIRVAREGAGHRLILSRCCVTDVIKSKIGEVVSSTESGWFVLLDGHVETRRHSVRGVALRIGENGRREIMLLTSRETRRWVIPKGWPMRTKNPPQVAKQEAFEEAGLVGEIIGKRPLGGYHYSKKLKKTDVLTEVLVYSFRVEKQAEDWPEKLQRETRWFNAAEAAALVDEGGLAGIIERFADISTRLAALPKRRKGRGSLPARDGGDAMNG